jgi:hypothetical protein
MADTAYKRYQKDVERQKKKKENYTQFQQVFLEAIDNLDRPKKPSRWFFDKDKDDIGALTLANVFKPIEMAVKTALPVKDKEGKVIKKPFYNINKFLRESVGMKEKEYISALDDLAKGVETGAWQFSGSIESLITAPIDLATGLIADVATKYGMPTSGTEFTTALEKRLKDPDLKPDEPETWRGLIAEVGVQYGMPASFISKLVNRANILTKLGKLLRLNGPSKASKVARRALEGATVVGATDFLASNDGRETFFKFTQPTDTKGLTGKKKAAAVLLNKIKYGAEGTAIGGGFPLMGKGLQLGYKWFGPKWAIGKTARLGARGANNLVFRPAAYIFGAEKYALPKAITKRVPSLEKLQVPSIAPLTKWSAKAIRGMTDWTLRRALAPTIVSGMRGKITKQLPPFEEWSLGSVVSRDPVREATKSLDNVLSHFRSYGKLPKPIHGISEEANLYGKSVAREIDRTYEGLERRAYQLAKGFEGRYNKNKTSPAGEKYWLDQIDEVLKGQRSLKEIPKELRGLTEEVKGQIQKVLREFRRALPKGKQGDEYTEDLHNTLVKQNHMYLVRSFQTFTNPNYAPPPKVKADAVNWLTKNVVAKNKDMKIEASKTFPTMSEAQQQKEWGKMLVDEIIIQGRAEGRNPVDSLKFIGQEILRDKKYKFLKTGEELPQAIRKVLGEEKNVKSSIALTVMNAMSSTGAKRAADAIAAQGLKGKWLFSTKEAARPFLKAPEQILRIPRLGVLKSTLEGLFGSPETVQMFTGVGNVLDRLVDMALYRHILQGKVGVQIGKTLYSPVTQVRNVTSASLFAFLNGHIGHQASVTDSFRMVIRDIFKAGKGLDEVQFNQQMAKLTRLGVLDENVVASEMKAVLKDINNSSINTMDDLFTRLIKMTPTDKVARLYAGGDNVWKFFGYNFSKSQLSEALHSVDDVEKWFKTMGGKFSRKNLIDGTVKSLDDALDNAAAYSIRNTYPTYSKVPPVIQNLRKFPLGNFISFPAEIIRTVTNVISFGLKEASSDNQVIRQMGIRRLVGAYLTLYGLGKGVTESAYYLTNSTPAQWAAYKRSFAPSWNKASDLIALEGWKNGESSAINFSYFMPYDVIQRPLEAAILQAQKQKLNPKEAEDFVFNMMFGENGPLMELMDPFISEPIGYDRFLDVTVRNGRIKGGGRVYTEQDDFASRINKSFAYVLQGVKPGLIYPTGEKIVGGIKKDVTKVGAPVKLFDEMIALFSGIRIIRIDAKTDMTFNAAQMNRLLRDVDEKEEFYTPRHYMDNTPGLMVKKFDEMQEDAFRLQKALYINIKDMQQLDMNKFQIEDLIVETGVNKKMASDLMDGIFTPVKYSKPRFEGKVKKIREALKERGEESDAYKYFVQSSFLFPEFKLDNVIDRWDGKRFFKEKWNPETKQREGGYYPEREDYKVDRKGNLILDEDGDPIRDTGIIGKGVRKAIDIIKKVTSPLADLYGQKPQVPPLPNTSMPNVAVAALQKSPQTGLTRSETALLSPSEQEIARRT